MSTLHEAAQQALEAWDGGDIEWFKRAYSVIDALRAALAEDALERMSEDERRLGIQLSTHSADCWKWHHQCAIAKIERESKHD